MHPHLRRSLRLLVVAVISTSLLCACPNPSTFGTAARNAENAVSKSSSIEDLIRAGDDLARVPASELDSAGVAQRTRLLELLDQQLASGFRAQLDDWAATSQQTAAAAGDDAERALRQDPRPQFLADLKQEAEDVVRNAACDAFAAAAYPVPPSGDDEEYDSTELAEELLSRLATRYGRGLGTVVAWYDWGASAAERANQIVTSLSAHPERVQLFANPALLRSVIAAEKFCNRLPTSK